MNAAGGQHCRNKCIEPGQHEADMILQEKASDILHASLEVCRATDVSSVHIHVQPSSTASSANIEWPHMVQLSAEACMFSNCKPLCAVLANVARDPASNNLQRRERAQGSDMQQSSCCVKQQGHYKVVQACIQALIEPRRAGWCHGSSSK